MKLQKAFVVVGNDTEVGKTTVTCQLIRAAVAHGKEVGAFKPAASGFPDCSPDSDAAQLIRALGRDVSLDSVCPYRFERPVAPVVAARELGIELSDMVIRQRLLDWTNACEVLFVETAGGLLSPLTTSSTNLDFVKQARFPALVVIENRLGAINQANLVCLALKDRGIRIAAIFFNQVRTVDQTVLTTNVELFEQGFSKLFDLPVPLVFSLAKGQSIADVDALRILS